MLTMSDLFTFRLIYLKSKNVFVQFTDALFPKRQLTETRVGKKTFPKDSTDRLKIRLSAHSSCSYFFVNWARHIIHTLVFRTWSAMALWFLKALRQTLFYTKPPFSSVLVNYTFEEYDAPPPERALQCLLFHWLCVKCHSLLLSL
jgi:hypothetical protein